MKAEFQGMPFMINILASHFLAFTVYHCVITKFPNKRMYWINGSYLK